MAAEQSSTRLTKRVIDALHYDDQGIEKRRHVVWDAALPGFGVRIYPQSKKFVLSYRQGGRKRLMTIGAYGPLSLDMARKEALKHLAAVQTAAADPLEERKRERKAATVATFCKTYIEDHAKPHKKTWKDDEGRCRRVIVPAWGRRRVKDIKRSDVVALHKKAGKERGVYEANRVLQQLGKMFSCALDWGVLPEDAPNPAKRVKKFSEEKRDRWVTPQELPRLMQEIDKVENPYIRSAFWLYLLTGMRKTEMLTAKWSDLDRERRELRLPETKPGRVHYVPLSAPAMTIIEQLPRLAGNPYMLPGQRRGQALNNIDSTWYKVRKAAGCGDVRLHDLRRTVGSWLAQSGNSLHLIGKVLNHSNTSTTAVYARFGQDQVREALEQHGKKLLSVAKGKGADVVELKR